MLTQEIVNKLVVDSYAKFHFVISHLFGESPIPNEVKFLAVAKTADIEKIKAYVTKERNRVLRNGDVDMDEIMFYTAVSYSTTFYEEMIRVLLTEDETKTEEENLQILEEELVRDYSTCVFEIASEALITTIKMQEEDKTSPEMLEMMIDSALAIKKKQILDDDKILRDFIFSLDATQETMFEAFSEYQESITDQETIARYGDITYAFGELWMELLIVTSFMHDIEIVCATKLGHQFKLSIKTIDYLSNLLDKIKSEGAADFTNYPSLLNE